MTKKTIIFVLLTGMVVAILYCWRSRAPKVHKTCGVGANRINEFSLDTTRKLVFYYPWKWDQKELRIYFEDIDDTALMKRVVDVANTWKSPTKIKFMRASLARDSDIRISFRSKQGYQSLIGSLADSAKLLDYDVSTTMWLEDLDRESDAEFKRVVLHEFGHAIGLLHELQSLNSPIKWDSSAVYAYFDSVYHWDTDKVNEQILTPIEYGEATTFDSHSIMIYAIPSFLMKNHPDIPWPDRLSRDDKTKIKLLYP